MKKLALPIAVVLALLSIAGCAQYAGQDYGYYGKGKAPPPPPVVTKG
jgi:predicted small secreted protein